MRKAILLLAVAAAAAAFLVPFRGKTAWERARRGGLPSASQAMRSLPRWFGGATPKRSAAAAPPAAAGRRAPEAGADRILKAPPQERLSRGDRDSLDRLVHARAR